MHLGKYLLENGIITPGQLEEALELQVACGGRLGTNLIELGHVGVDALAECLARHSGLPLPPADWVEQPQPEALKAVPLDTVRRLKILPMRIEGRTLHVAMLDPLDPPQIDELAFATGYRIKPYVLPEAAVFFWLDRHLGVPREIRFIEISGRKARDRAAGLEEAKEDIPSAGRAEFSTAAAQAMAALGVRPLDLDEELVDEHTFSELQTSMYEPEAPRAGKGAPRPVSRAPAGVPPGEADAATPLPPRRGRTPVPEPEPGTPARIADLEHGLMGASTRAEVVEATLRLARAYVPAAALFIVHRGMIAGVRASGGKLDRRIRALMIPTESESFLSIAATTGEPVRGMPPRQGIDARLLDALGQSAVKQVAVLPVKIRNRVVNLLYVDRGAEAIGETTLAALQALCSCTSASYERLILARKRRIG